MLSFLTKPNLAAKRADEILDFLGVMGEYVGAIYTQVQKRPYAVELERINFEYPPELPKTT